MMALSTGQANDDASLGRNLTYGLLERLGSGIVTGQFNTIAFPTEAELARQNGVSRSVTREAVKMLTAKGLLSARPRQGTVIEPTSSWNLFDPDILRWLLNRRSSIDLVRQFNQLRLGIEPEAAALAARFAKPVDLQRMERCLLQMAEAERHRDPTLDADIGFHVAVLSGTGNPFYAQFRDVITSALNASIRLTSRVGQSHGILANHRRVFDAIVAQDAAAAFATMRRLIVDALDLVEQYELMEGETRS